MVEAAPLSVAILCGGGSRRMGQDKNAVVVDDASLLDRAIARLWPIATTVLLASGATPVRREGCVTVPDTRPGGGPLAGIVAALAASPQRFCAVVAVDMPDADVRLLRTLAARCAGHDAAVPRSTRGVEPLHAVYARSALPALTAALESSDTSVHRALRALRVCYVSAGAAGAGDGFARNLNTPDDVTAWTAERRAGAPPPQ